MNGRRFKYIFDLNTVLVIYFDKTIIFVSIF
jgi:hypothetical protein